MNLLDHFARQWATAIRVATLSIGLTAIASAGPLADGIRQIAPPDVQLQQRQAAFEASRKRLLDALAQLDAHLAKQATGTSWVRYLQLNSLRKQLAEPSPDLDQLASILGRFRGMHPGLEYAPLRRVRLQLDDFLRLSRAQQSQISSDEITQRLERVAQLVDQYESKASSSIHAELADELRWFDRNGIDDPQLLALRPYVSHPNVYLTMDGRVISDWTRDRTERDVDINRREGKQRTTGFGKLEGYSAVYPVQGTGGRGRLEIRFEGTLRTYVTTNQGPVYVRTHGIAPIHAVRPVYVTDEGLIAAEPQISVRYHNHVDGVRTTFRQNGLLDRLVRRIAINSVRRDWAEIEYEAAEGAKKEFDESFREEIAEELDEANDGLLNRMRNPLLRQDLYPRRFEFHTTPDALDVWLLFDSHSELAAPHAPPQFATRPAIGVRMHETCVNNLAGQALAGRLLMVSELDQLIRDAIPTGLQPESGEDADDDDALGDQDLGIEFASDRPISVVFDDNLITVTVRATRFIYEERTYPPMNIIVRYRLHQENGVLRATREGEPEYVAPPGVGGLRVITLRKILRNHINPRLESEYVQSEVRLPDSDGEDEVGPLEFAEATAKRGWLTINLVRAKLSR